MVHFIRPLWLWLIMPASIYYLFVIYAIQSKNPWRKICDPHLLPDLLQQGQHASNRIFYSSLYLFFLITIFTLAGPAWNKTSFPTYREMTATLLVLDLSPAMLQTDLDPNRLIRAKFKIRDFILNSQQTQMGLVVFSREAFIALPLSDDANTLTAMLDELHPQMMPVSGSDTAEGLKLAHTLLTQTGSNHGRILLITSSEPSANSFSVAKNIQSSGNRLDILAMFQPSSDTQATFDALKKLARFGGGSVALFTPDDADIQQLRHGHRMVETVKDSPANDVQDWNDAGPWFCLLLIPLILLILHEKSA